MQKSLFFCCVFFIDIFVVSHVQAQDVVCKAVPLLEVKTESEETRQLVCEAAKRTIDFLSPYKLYPLRTINVEIVERGLTIRGYKAVGSYDRQRDKVQMMSLSALHKGTDTPEMYDMPLDQEQYIGAIAHELTHAIFNHNAPPIEEKWNNSAQEYLAHAVQMGVLGSDVREKIIATSKSGPWETGDEVSVTYMAFNPTGFAVKSYLHLTQLDDPKKFVQLLLNHKWLYVSVP
jgi:hypothetical protein